MQAQIYIHREIFTKDPAARAGVLGPGDARPQVEQPSKKSATEGALTEKWSQKYKRSINCSHPRGFSQRAHCAGKKKHTESQEVMEMTCPDCGMCETHGDPSRNTLDEACWKGYHKEGMKTMETHDLLTVLRGWQNREPAQYAWHLSKTFGDPHDATPDQIIWHDKDGFKRIEIKNEYVMHTSPVPHYDYCYSYIDLKLPHRLSSVLADCSESILIDHLKNEVGARCASLAANAVTLNFVMDVVAGRTQPTRDEYESRIMHMHHEFDNGNIFTLDWWPDQSHDTNPKNPYYSRKQGNDVQVEATEQACPHCAGPMFSELMMTEKKDACYYKVKSRYKVWPSAYASGALVKCRKKGVSHWGNKSESLDENLHDWFHKEKWVRFGPDGKIRGDCARGSESEGKPKCLPASKAHALGKKGRASAASKKRRNDPNPERRGHAINVATKKESFESVDFGAEVDALLNEMSASSVATAPGRIGNPAKVGSLFGGSYSQKNSPFRKKSTKRESMIKRDGL